MESASPGTEFAAAQIAAASEHARAVSAMIVSVGGCQPETGQQAPSVTSTLGIPQQRLRASTTEAAGSPPMRAPPTSCTAAPGGGADQNVSIRAGSPSRPGRRANAANLLTVRPPAGADCRGPGSLVREAPAHAGAEAARHEAG